VIYTELPGLAWRRSLLGTLEEQGVDVAVNGYVHVALPFGSETLPGRC
jgi:hypothetical protein